MLAQNFKTPTDLGISDIEFDALLKVLGMLEREEIKPEQFTMDRVLHNCGTPACMCGWANYVSEGKAFPLRNRKYSTMEPSWKRIPKDLLILFAYGSSAGPDMARRATTSQAANALRSYLTHGEARWAEALA